MDLPRLARAGEWTWLGILGVAQALLLTGILLVVPGVSRRLVVALWPAAALVVWAVAGLLWQPPTDDALANALAYLLLGASVAAAAIVTASASARTAHVLERTMVVVSVVGLGIAALSFASHGFHVHGWSVHPRAFALAALVPLSWYVARAARAARGHVVSLLVAAVWLAAIVVSLSRMATAAALVVILLAGALQAGRSAGSWGRAAILGVLLLTTGAAVATIAPFRSRLMKQDRMAIWTRAIDSGMESPLLGNGLGSSQVGPALRYWWESPPPGRGPVGQRYEYWEYWAPHPHNEYLRVWHDLGLVGLALLLLALGGWLRILLLGSRRGQGDPSRGEPQLELAGLLALVALMLAMLTDNPLVYPFVIAPAGVLIGAGLGAALRVER